MKEDILSENYFVCNQDDNYHTRKWLWNLGIGDKLPIPDTKGIRLILLRDPTSKFMK